MFRALEQLREGKKKKQQDTAVVINQYGLSSNTHIPFYILELVKMNRLETVRYI